MLPTLNELLERLIRDVPFRDSCKELYRRVASGERHPTEPPLPDNVIVFACQAMSVLFAHVELETKLQSWRSSKPGDVLPGNFTVTEVVDGHVWGNNSSLIPGEHCRICLMMRRADKANRPCKGPQKLRM